jgi:hypothetical protein
MDYLQRGINRCVEPCGGGGGITAGDNVGGGPGEVFRDITAGTTFNLRTILSPTGTVSIVTNGDVVELEATASNVGGGEGIFAGQVLADKQFKTLTSTGATVTITSTATTVNLEAVGGGGGEVNTASNIGAGTGVFSSKVGTDLEFKSLTSTGGTVAITNTATTVNVESASDAVTSSTFTDSGAALEFTLAAVASVSQVISRVSTRNTTSGNNETVSYEIIVTSDGTTISGSTDIVQVDGPTPLTTLALSVVDNAGNINLRFTRTGGGDNIQLHFASSTLPI